MAAKKKNIDTFAIMKRYGDGRNSSVREISKEFDIPESTLRGLMETSARQGLPWPRDFRLHRIDVLAARLDQCTYELGELRRELAERD